MRRVKLEVIGRLRHVAVVVEQPRRSFRIPRSPAAPSRPPQDTSKSAESCSEGVVREAVDDAILGGQNHRPFDDVFQFAHIARPVIEHQHVERWGGNALDVHPHLPGKLADEMVGQGDDVATRSRSGGTVIG